MIDSDDKEFYGEGIAYIDNVEFSVIFQKYFDTQYLFRDIDVTSVLSKEEKDDLSYQAYRDLISKIEYDEGD